MKLKATNNELIFYFRLFVDYFGESEHPLAVKEEEERIAENNITDSIFYKNVNVTISENIDKKEISTILSALRKIEEVVGFTLDELNNSISISVTLLKFPSSKNSVAVFIISVYIF